MPAVICSLPSQNDAIGEFWLKLDWLSVSAAQRDAGMKHTLGAASRRILKLCAVLLCSSVHKEIPRHLALPFTHPQFSKSLNGIWSEHPVFQDAQCFQRMASQMRLFPLYPWTTVKYVLDRTVQEFYPGATTSLEGSHSDGTAVQGISDYDVWILTPRPIDRRERRMLFEHLLKAFQDHGFYAYSRECGIGRKAMKFRIGEVESANPAIDLDVVCLRMNHDIGLDDHNLPLFTRCGSRDEARREATRCVHSDPRLQMAISAMKGLSSNGRSGVIPGFLLNHFARRLFSEGIESSLSSLVIFQRMVEYFFSFCELQDILAWPSNRSDLDAALDEARKLGDSTLEELHIKSEIWMDLLRDCLHYDEEHRGSNWVRRLGRTCRQARNQLQSSFQAIANKDMQYFSNHICIFGRNLS